MLIFIHSEIKLDANTYSGKQMHYNLILFLRWRKYSLHDADSIDQQMAEYRKLVNKNKIDFNLNLSQGNNFEKREIFN